MVKIKFIVALVATLGLIFGQAVPASADSRYFQYTPSDTDYEDTISGSSYDILSGQMAITADGDFEYFMVLAQDAETGNGGTYGVMFDLNLDGNSDYWMYIDGNDLGSSVTDINVYDYDSSEDQYCTASAWTTTAGEDSAIGFSLAKGCLAFGAKVNVQFYASSSQESNFDFAPMEHFEFKTSYMSGQTCTAAKSGKKITYLGKTYVCMKSGSKWSYKDYGVQLAAKAKYFTDKAFYTCLYGKFGASLADSNKTLQISGAGKYLITSTDFDCVQRVAKFPSWLQSQIGMTRALDGMQKASYSGYIVTWNYHPDDGVNMTIRKTK